MTLKRQPGSSTDNSGVIDESRARFPLVKFKTPISTHFGGFLKDWVGRHCGEGNCERYPLLIRVGALRSILSSPDGRDPGVALARLWIWIGTY